MQLYSHFKCVFLLERQYGLFKHPSTLSRSVCWYLCNLMVLIFIKGVKLAKIAATNKS